MDDVYKVIIEIWKAETMPEEWNTKIIEEYLTTCRL